MSDQECRAGRICHEGRCRFLEEVRNKRIKSVQLQEGPGGSTDIRAKRTDDTDRGPSDLDQR